MPTRRQFLGHAAAAMASLALPAEEPIISDEDLVYVEDLARRTIRAATKQDSIPSLGFPVVTPGGDYPSLWVRDFSMAAGCGLVPAEAVLKHLRLIALSQNGPDEKRFGSRAIIPPYAIPDHVRYDGGAVFYPGTYSAGDDQGGEPYGVLPPVDDHYEFIHVAHQYWKMTGETEFLGNDVAGLTLQHRLELALVCPQIDQKNGLVITDMKRRAVGFGFCDGVYLTGHLLFASLLRYRALGEMAALAKAMGRKVSGFEWERQRHLIRSNLAPVFQQDGWLIAATEVGRQSDVWGTALALHMRLLTGQSRSQAETALYGAYHGGRLTHLGAVRHIPTDRDFSAFSAWERTAGIAKNRYQNGAYWHVPTGWLASALWSIDRSAARSLVREMTAHFREQDFRKGKGFGGPWECLHPEGDYRQNAVYMASVTLPLEVLKQIRGKS